MNYESAKPTRGDEPLLFTPGPLTTSLSSKSVMLKDLGSRDPIFLNVVASIRSQLLELANVSRELEYDCILMPGSGTLGVESMIQTVPQTNAKMIVVINGAYGERILKMAGYLHIPTVALRYPENKPFSVTEIMKTIENDTSISHIAVIHHETSAGVLNPIADLGQAIKKFKEASGRPMTYMVDSMSAFGVYEANLHEDSIDFLVSSSNKCIEGMPGFSFVLANTRVLQTCKGNARSLSLDLYDQWMYMNNNNNQFRFTPPTHVLLAFHQALKELKEEGGMKARYLRYKENGNTLLNEMKSLGFHSYVEPQDQGCIIFTFLYPNDPTFNFLQMYNSLAKNGYVIYPGKLTNASCFRIGCIGRLFPQDMTNLVIAIRENLLEQGVALPVTQIIA
jgi:2-aminoethylphosphonate-pyruvate transaminase